MHTSVLLIFLLVLQGCLGGKETPRPEAFIEATLHHLKPVGWQLSPLTDGLSDALIYKALSVRGDEWVVRYYREPAVHKNEIKREFSIMQAVADNGIAPKVHFVSLKEGIVIMDRAENIEDVTLKIRTLQIRLKEVAQKLKQLHLMDASIFIGKLSMVKEAQSYLQTIIPTVADNSVKDYLDTLFSELIGLESLSHGFKGMPIHGDFHILNIMAGESSLYFIDWENASLDDPYLDIAAFVLTTPLSDEQAWAFLEAYLGKEPTLEDLSRLQLAKYVKLVDWGSGLLLTLKQNSLDEATWRTFPSLDEWLKHFEEQGWGDKESINLGWVFLKEAYMLIHTQKYQEAKEHLRYGRKACTSSSKTSGAGTSLMI